MRESASAAFSFIQSEHERFGTPLRNFAKKVHIHVPNGAVPKDGPSAGIVIATSILSAFLGKAPNMTCAMTGEITLRGSIAIGGLREKVHAAVREGLSTLFIPVQNKGAFEALPVAQRKQVQVHFVSEYHEVFDKLFGESSADETPSSAVASAVAKNNPIKNMSP